MLEVTACGRRTRARRLDDASGASTNEQVAIANRSICTAIPAHGIDTVASVAYVMRSIETLATSNASDSPAALLG